MQHNHHCIRKAGRGRGEFRFASRPGFTLVELLMVMLIISMLVALVSSAVWNAKVSATNARVTLEINQMAMKLRDRDANGGYPPDLQNWPDAEILVRLKQMFPKWNDTVNPPPAFLSDSNRLNRLDEAEQLVFFLGGYWDGNKMRGFNAHPRTPFLAVTGSPGEQRTPPHFDFVETRLFDRDGDTFPEYYPDLGSPVDAMPYVLFVARRAGRYEDYNNNPPIFGPSDSPGIIGTAVPLISSAGSGTDWVDSDSFQILCAGIDGDFGPLDALYFPSGRNYGNAHYDNLTSFARGTLGKSIP